jgi:hypothetical protein
MEGDGELHTPAAFPQERAPGTQWMGGWVVSRADPDCGEEKESLSLAGIEKCLSLRGKNID